MDLTPLQEAANNLDLKFRGVISSFLIQNAQNPRTEDEKNKDILDELDDIKAKMEEYEKKYSEMHLLVNKKYDSWKDRQRVLMDKLREGDPFELARYVHFRQKHPKASPIVDLNYQHPDNALNLVRSSLIVAGKLGTFDNIVYVTGKDDDKSKDGKSKENDIRKNVDDFCQEQGLKGNEDTKDKEKYNLKMTPSAYSYKVDEETTRRGARLD